MSKILLKKAPIVLTNTPLNLNFIRLLCEALVDIFLKMQVLFRFDWLTRVFSPQHSQISDVFREVFNSWKLYERSYQFYLVQPRLSSLAAIIYTMAQHTSHRFETRPD